jgi:hypothetical protein
VAHVAHVARVAARVAVVGPVALAQGLKRQNLNLLLKALHLSSQHVQLHLNLAHFMQMARNSSTKKDKVSQVLNKNYKKSTKDNQIRTFLHFCLPVFN